MPNDPIAEWEAYEKRGAEKKAAAIRALKKTLKLTEKKLLALGWRRPSPARPSPAAAAPADGTEKPPRKKYEMSPSHKKKIRLALKKRAAEKRKAAAKARGPKRPKRVKIAPLSAPESDAN
jgi:hypothetical protein